MVPKEAQLLTTAGLMFGVSGNLLRQQGSRKRTVSTEVTRPRVDPCFGAIAGRFSNSFFMAVCPQGSSAGPCKCAAKRLTGRQTKPTLNVWFDFHFRIETEVTLVSNCQRLLYDNPQSIPVSSAVVQPMRFVAWIVGSVGNLPKIEEPACRAAS